MSAKTHAYSGSEALPPLPVGYHQFTKHPHLNYELNRCYNSVGDACLADLRAVGARIHDFKTWVDQMLGLATKAKAAEQLYRAAIYFRFAEFFIEPTDPRKQPTYDEFTKLFNAALPHVAEARFLVPYEGGQLPGWHLRPPGAVRATVVVFGGFDSFLEELYCYLAYCQERGIEIYAFEGPGQGAALKTYHLPMTHEWEKPVKAVLDHFKLENVTVMGLSLGGYLATRAAAFEPRITRLVAFDVLYDFFAAATNSQIAPLRAALKTCVALKAKPLLNILVPLSMKIDFLANWGVPHGMHVCGVATPFEFFEAIGKMTLNGLTSRITQDVLLMAGESDHMVPLWMIERQKREMVNAKSITTRIFTDAESAGSHCQVGNLPLALDYLIEHLTKA